MRGFRLSLVVALVALANDGAAVRAERRTGNVNYTDCKNCSKCPHCRSGATCSARLPHDASPAEVPGTLLVRPNSTANKVALATVPNGMVTRFVDGDTIIVQHNRKPETVCLIGVDTPEAVDPRKPLRFFAKEAAAFTRRFALSKRVRLYIQHAPRDRDRYVRLLAYSVRESVGLLMNNAIVSEGYGLAFVKYPSEKIAEFRKAEAQARKSRRGLCGAMGKDLKTIMPQALTNKRTG